MSGYYLPGWQVVRGVVARRDVVGVVERELEPDVDRRRFDNDGLFGFRRPGTIFGPPWWTWAKIFARSLNTGRSVPQWPANTRRSINLETRGRGPKVGVHLNERVQRHLWLQRILRGLSCLGVLSQEVSNSDTLSVSDE